MASPSGPSDPASVLIRISPMAHIASAFVAVFVLAFFPAWGPGALSMLVVPVLMSLAIERLRTTADQTSITARTMLKSKTIPWTHVEGLRFDRSKWARACRQDGSEQILPAVTFTELPKLSAVSGGRVPDPYKR